MVHINHSPFETFVFNTLDKQKVEHHVLVMRGTFKITSNARLNPADVQAPVLVSDQLYGEPDSSGCRQESDLSPFKPACDIVLDATAYAPGGKPTQAWMVSVSVGQHRKQLRVSGPRWFSHHLTGWHVTSVMPIHTLPVRYEYAYGGTVTVYDFKTRQERTDCCDRNPYPQGDERIELHNLSSEGHLAFTLPGHFPFVLVRHAKGQISQVAANLDTLFIEPQARRVSLVWRALVKCVPPVRALESRMISSRQKHAMSKETSHGR